ncbi:methyltransferase domain-containing protein [Pacificibacter sp. AS14]|uniref:class I SAM-dependent methyltransferase n=1 Tax=Pacificibacter sp. AS14 TaxID=3135785 RepID=UPI003174A450
MTHSAKPSATFWNLIAKKYIAGNVADQATYARKLAQTQSLLKSDWSILEVGCGSGNTAMTHAPFVAQVTGIDFAHKMIEHAQAESKKRGIENVIFEHKGLDDLSADQSFNAVLMLSVLHLQPDWKRAIRKAYALTSAGGVFISSTACIKDMSPVIAKLAPLISALPILPSLVSFTQDDLLTEMRSAGFEIEDNWRASPKDATFVVARKPA